MPAIEPILSHATPLMLVVFRLAGLFLFTPLLANRMFPRRFRIMLAVMLGAAVYAGLPAAARSEPSADLPGLVALVLGESLIGAAIGFIASIPMAAFEMAGLLMGTQMGLGLARVYNPEVDSETDVLGQLLLYAALAIFVAGGGLESLFGTLLGTFERVPPGTLGAPVAPLAVVVGVFGAGFDLALRVAAPVLCIVFLMLLAMGFITKTMPQVNVLSVGFSIKIGLGLAVLAASMGIIGQVAGEELGWALRLAAEWSSSL